MQLMSSKASVRDAYNYKTTMRGGWARAWARRPEGPARGAEAASRFTPAASRPGRLRPSGHPGSGESASPQTERPSLRPGRGRSGQGERGPRHSGEACRGGGRRGVGTRGARRLPEGLAGSLPNAPQPAAKRCPLRLRAVRTGTRSTPTVQGRGFDAEMLACHLPLREGPS